MQRQFCRLNTYFQMFPRLILMAVVLVTTCFGQHARDYYKEIYQAGGLDRMSDAYVCFPDDADADNFFLIAQSKWMREAMVESGLFEKLSRSQQAEMKKDF